MKLRIFSALCILLALSGIAIPAKATADYSYIWYVGADNWSTLQSREDAKDIYGLTNPNYNRLTMLYAHYVLGSASHFHGTGSYYYDYDSDGTPYVVSSKPGWNHIPAEYQRGIDGGQDYLVLTSGTGIFDGKLISGNDGGHFSNLTIQPVGALALSDDSNNQTLYASASARWSSLSTANTTFGMELVNISDGLHVATESGGSVFSSVGDIATLGTGNSWSFKPVFWTDNSATPGIYSATFRFKDITQADSCTPYGDGGEFTYDFRVVPEPGSVVSLATGLLSLILIRRKRQ